jgi:four helix bundle protein
MGVRRLEDLIAWQLASAFKVEVYRLLKNSQTASADFRFRDQIRDAAASIGMNIGEGFYRYRAREFGRFLSIALASLGEAELWLHDGIEREHFTQAECETAFTLGKRCRIATLRLLQSLQPFMDQKKDRKKPKDLEDPKNLKDSTAPKGPKNPEGSQ